MSNFPPHSSMASQLSPYRLHLLRPPWRDRTMILFSTSPLSALFKVSLDRQPLLCMSVQAALRSPFCPIRHWLMRSSSSLASYGVRLDSSLLCKTFSVKGRNCPPPLACLAYLRARLLFLLMASSNDESKSELAQRLLIKGIYPLK